VSVEAAPPPPLAFVHVALATYPPPAAHATLPSPPTVVGTVVGSPRSGSPRLGSPSEGGLAIV
jgi:hypothetical protein